MSTEGEGTASASLFRMIRQGVSWSGHERNCCFLNTGQQRFVDVSAASGFDFPEDGRGMALVDWDHDGDLDVWINNRNGPQIRFLRNDIPTENHFLSVHLEGTTSNRDAIGARVEVILKSPDSDPINTDPVALSPALIKTLHAGDGYLAQSSKWLHFGLGDATLVERLVVHWPGGETEEFDVLETDRRYKILQGTGRTTPWPFRTPSKPLTPSPLVESPSSDQVQVFTASRIPMPRLPYETFEGGSALVFEDHDGAKTDGAKSQGPVLLNLWASWCRPCLLELKDFASDDERIAKSGLRFVALSVDGLGDQAGDSHSAQQMASRLKLPFATGMATSELMEKIQMLHDEVLETRRPLPVPTSFLIDGERRLAAIYKGPVPMDRLLADVQKLKLSAEDRLSASLPFSGHWFARPSFFRLAELGRKLVAHGYLEDAADYVARYRDQLQQDRKLPFLLADLGTSYEKQNDLNHAVEYYADAVKLKPGVATAHATLGAALMRLGRMEKALVEYQTAIRLNPDLVVAHFNLGLLLGKFRKTDEAIKHLTRVVTAKPDFLSAHFQLAVLFEQKGRSADACAEYRAVLRIDSTHAAANNNLAWILATHADPHLRNGTQAVEFAERCARDHGENQPGVLDTLAASYAEAGRFLEAQTTAEQALKMARSQSNQALTKDIQRRLDLYRNEKPYRAK
ncbi:MAG: tetratricopeptide repeat protein [Pirellulales bacterium]